MIDCFCSSGGKKIEWIYLLLFDDEDDDNFSGFLGDTFVSYQSTKRKTLGQEGVRSTKKRPKFSFKHSL